MTMQDNTTQTLDRHKMQLITGLGAVAESLRQTATFAENFATYLQQTTFVPQSQASASASANANSNFPMNMFPMFFGGGMGMSNGYQQQGGQIMSPVEAKPEEGEADGKKRKRGRAAADDKEKKGRKAKDLLAPKRPPSAYLLFQNEVRKAMQQKYPGLAYSEVLGKVSEKWSTLSPEQKSTYEIITKAAKEKYALRKKTYDDAVNSGMSKEEAHKLAETTHPDPIPVDVVVPEKEAEESEDEDASEEASPIVPAAAVESDTDSDSDEPAKPTKPTKANDSDSNSESEEDEEEETPKVPPSKKQKTKAPVSEAKSKPAPKEKETKKREYKKKDKKKDD